MLGNPSGEVLGKFKRNGAAHVDFDFATQKGIGVAQLVPHASTECVDLITKVHERQDLRLSTIHVGARLSVCSSTRVTLCVQLAVEALTYQRPVSDSAVSLLNDFVGTKNVRTLPFGSLASAGQMEVFILPMRHE